MKVSVRKFSSDQVNLSVNISSWSNKEVAKFLNNLVKPKSAEAKIHLSDDQIKIIKYCTNWQEPKNDVTFKELYQQYKSTKLSPNPDKFASIYKSLINAPKFKGSFDASEPYYMTKFMQNVFKTLNIKCYNPHVSKSFTGFNYLFEFIVNTETVQAYKCYSRDGNIGEANARDCVLDSVVLTIVKDNKFDDCQKDGLHDLLEYKIVWV